MPDSGDSIDFFARYKGWAVARSINIADNTDPKEIASYIVSVREDVDKRAFEVLGIDLKILESYSEKISKPLQKRSYSELVNIYKQLGSPDTESEVGRATSNREELKPFGKAYIMRAAMKNMGIDFYITRDNKAFNGKAQGQKATTQVPFNQDGISFMAKYKDWVSVKKMSIDAKTKPEEVSAHLSSIRITADRKAAAILGVNTESLDMHAAAHTENLRKSAANLEKICTLMGSPETNKETEAACNGNQALKDAAQTYLFSTMLQNIKIDFEISPNTLMDMFPGLKIPKPKGRMPGQKKKKPA